MSGPYAKLADDHDDQVYNMNIDGSNKQSASVNLEFHQNSNVGGTSEVSGKLGAGAPSTASSPIHRISSGQSASGTGASSSSNVPNTLDEPIQETIMRDLRNIWKKLLQVMDPRPNNKQNVLKDWDWWGPLLLCLALSLRLSISIIKNAEDMFTTTFVIIWFGGAAVSLNAQLLGGKISFFQSVCVLGYCIFPLVCIVYVWILIPFLFLQVILLAVCFAWSTYASMNFLAEVNLERKKLLALYPIFLFYFALSWLIFLTLSTPSHEPAKPPPAATPT